MAGRFGHATDTRLEQWILKPLTECECVAKE